ncbi:MAG: hypothetical protein Q4C81_09575 [Kocuria sp.]|nr:hypothetical protein [Kocuria sp.]
MPYITFESFSEWETPGTFRLLADDLKDHSSNFFDRVEDARDQWKGLEAIYKGPSQDMLYSGLDKQFETAEEIKNAGKKLSIAVVDFCDVLDQLWAERNDTVEASNAFNLEHGQKLIGDLDFVERMIYENHVTNISSLERRYQEAVDILVDKLKMPDQAWFGGVAGTVAEEVFQAGILAMGSYESKTTTYRGSSRRLEVTADGRHGAGSNGRITEKYTNFELEKKEVTLFGTPLKGSGVLEYFKSDIERYKELRRNFNLEKNAVKRQGPGAYTRWVAGRFVKNFAAQFSLVELSNTNKKLKDKNYSSHSKSDLSDSNDQKIYDQSSFEKSEKTSDLTKYLVKGGKYLGAAGSVLGVGFTFSSEREKNLKELAENNPGMSKEEIEKEATFDATANTIGQVGTSMFIGGIFGALAGTFIAPGPGTLTGGLIGIGVGFGFGLLSENIKFIPDTNGDGEKESIVSAGGNGAEYLANGTRDLIKK